MFNKFLKMFGNEKKKYDIITKSITVVIYEYIQKREKERNLLKIYTQLFLIQRNIEFFTKKKRTHKLKDS